MLEDAIAFNKYHYSNSMAIKKQRAFGTVYLPVIAATLFVLHSVAEHDVKILVYGAVFIVFYLLLIHRSYSKGIYKTAKKLYEEQDMSNFTCEHLLEIDEDRITCKTDISEGKIKWSGIQKIAFNNGYAFICLGLLQAYIVPRERIIEGDFDQFIETAQAYWQEYNSKKGNSADA